MDEKRQKETERRRQMDDFWDVDALLPKKKPMIYASDTSTAEIVIEERESGASPAVQTIPARKESPTASAAPSHTSTASSVSRLSQPELEYAPTHPLLHRVRVYRWRSDYHYYEAFYRDAVKLYAIHGEACERAPYFSYVPQYSQLNRLQLEWYLWWREQFRNGEAPDTDYSYLLLYAYELLNLSTNVDPVQTRELLLRLWKSYREIFHQLDAYLPEWICDLCLLHRLPPPEEQELKLQLSLLSHCNLKEFYVSGTDGDAYLRALLTFCSNYDYRKSKFYADPHRELFDRAILGSLRAVSERTEAAGKLFSAIDQKESRLMRDAYTGALCSPRIRRRIEVEYCAFSRSHELRFLVTDIVKYAENQVRASLGIRSRLGIYALPMPVRLLMDAYLTEILPAKRLQSAKRAEEIPTYEKLYDAPHTKLSFTAAEEIERLSWDTTERLIEAFDAGEDAEVTPCEASAPIPPLQSEKEQGATQPEERIMEEWSERSPFAPYVAFLHAVLEANVTEQRRTAQNAGLSPEVLADAINALAADEMGDILLEEDGAGYCVIEDYREWLSELLSRLD